jgi:ATP-dependent DNA ligase
MRASCSMNALLPKARSQACALGCEGIVSKRLGSPYRSGRADCWLKENPAAPAVTREAEEWN